MSSPSAVVVTGTVPCRVCGDGEAEMEEDGEVRYWACPECDSEFGYEQVAQADGACAIGVPEEVRRAASPPVIAGPTIPLGAPHVH